MRLTSLPLTEIPAPLRLVDAIFSVVLVFEDACCRGQDDIFSKLLPLGRVDLEFGMGFKSFKLLFFF